MRATGISETIRSMKKGDVKDFPISWYSSVCSTVSRFNREFRVEGRHYAAKDADLHVRVMRTA